jgi:hypothetical protein
MIGWFGLEAAARSMLLTAFVFAVTGCSAVPNLDQGGMGCQNAGDGQHRDGSPTDPGQPLAGVDVVGRTPADVGRLAEAQGLIVRYGLQYATADGGGYGECWCTPPTEGGTVTQVFWGSNGQLFIESDAAMKPTARNQPTYGWGCDGMFG